MNLKIHARIIRQKNNAAIYGWGSSPLKCLLVMKLILILTMAFCLNTSAVVLGQDVTIAVKGATFKSVLKSIQRQSGYSFMITQDLIEKARPVTIDVQSKDLKEVLPILFKDQPFTYELSGKLIKVKSKADAGSLLEPMPSNQQQTIRGRVTDSLGKPLEGVTVQISGTRFKTSTDSGGQYEFSGAPVGASLLFHHLSYEPLEVFIDRAEINVTLKFRYSYLDEPVVIAYGTTTKRLNTGSVSSLKADDIQKQPIADPILALAGRVSGFYVATGNGIPGANPQSIRLRGQNSISNGNDPLFLIDGIPFNSETLTDRYAGGGATAISPFNAINPSEIESIEILKDAAATAIYGSRGANGVVLITTKKGKAGKTKIDINAQTGISQLAKRIKLLDTKRYLEMRREAFRNDGMEPKAIDYDVNGTWDTTRYTDWQKLLIGNNGLLNNIQGNISGGTLNTQFLIGAGLRKESTVFPGDYSDSKVSFHSNLNHVSESRKFGVNVSTRFLRNKSNLPKIDFASLIYLPPNAPRIYDEKGNLNWENSTWNNPFSNLMNDAIAKTDNLHGNALIFYRPIKSIEIKSTLGYNKIRMDQSIITRLTSFDPSYSNNSSLRSHRFPNTERTSWIIEPQITYKKELESLKIDALLGSTFQESNNKVISQGAFDFINDYLIESVSAAASSYISSYSEEKYKYNALFSRLTVNWKDRYLLSLNGRRDGSSRFGPENQFGNFGAIGVGWIFSEEPFIKHSLPFLNFGKIRSSYGVTGNDQIPDYQFLSTYSTYEFPYQGRTGLYPSRISNPAFGWESVRKLEFGIELSILKERIYLNSGYYQNRTTNQLVGFSLPAITGFENITANLPAVIENKGWELEISSENIKNKHFNWRSSFNISFPRNKLVSYPDLESSTYATRYIIGKSLFIQQRTHFMGLNPQTGVYEFEDVNQDGIISSPQDLQALKERSQIFFGGIQNSLSYKGLFLDFHFQFVKQTGLNHFNVFPSLPGRMNNQPIYVLDRWRKEGDITGIQKFSQSTSSQAGRANNALRGNSDGVLGDASFIRLRNVSASYVLPDSWISTVKLSQVRLYCQAQNLFTITGYKGIDPETQRTGLPTLVTYVFGLHVTF